MTERNPAEIPGQSPGGKSKKLKLIGTSYRRVDGMAKVTGQTVFADDYVAPRMVHMKLVRSTVPHAKIMRIDTSVAERMDGVITFLTGADMPKPFGILPVSQDEHALCQDIVRFVGDPVVAVIATTEDAAAEAALAVEIEYETLPTIASVEEAIATPAPQMHDYADEGNIHKVVSMKFGDVDAGFEEADMVLEDDCFFEGNTHLPMEQHATVAIPEPDGKITVYSSTQTPHYLHKAMTKVLEIPASHIRIIAAPNGGGFGGKSDPFNHEICVAKMAMKLGRPVKICLTREEVFYCHRGPSPGAHASEDRLQEGRSHHRPAPEDGARRRRLRQLRRRLDVLHRGAADRHLQAAALSLRLDARLHQQAALRSQARSRHAAAPLRLGRCTLDKAAEKLGIVPGRAAPEERPRPGHGHGELPEASARSGCAECIEAVVEGSNFKERYGKQPSGEGRGLGVACSSYLTGAGLPIYWNHMPHSGVQLKFDRSGGIAAFCGETEIGQGSDTVLAACIAEVLGVDLMDIRLCVADTDLTPVDLGSYSSRVTIMMGNAAIQAAERAKELIAKAVSEKLEVPTGRLVFADRKVFDAEDPEKHMEWPDAVIAAESKFGTLGTTGSYAPPRSPGRFRGAGVGPSPCYSYSACILEVEVDPETGMYQVDHVWMAHDVGQSINAASVMNQIEGSIYMGLGEATMEESAFRRLPKRMSNALVHKFPSLLEYKSPTFLDMPKMTTYVIEDPDPNGPFGAKEVGQGPLLPIMPALANAIHDAVGVRIDQVPIGPHMILKALDEKAKGRPARFGPGAYPDFDFGEPLDVPTQDEGGDGKALNNEARGLRADRGTMKITKK